MTTSAPLGTYQASLLADLNAALGGRWPGALCELPDQPVPLAIGIGNAIAGQLGMDKAARRVLGHALMLWVGRPTYLVNLARKGAMRHGLDGQPTEPVSDEHRRGARERLKGIRERRKKRQREPAEGKAGVCWTNADKPTLRLGRIG